MYVFTFETSHPTILHTHGKPGICKLIVTTHTCFSLRVAHLRACKKDEKLNKEFYEGIY